MFAEYHVGWWIKCCIFTRWSASTFMGKLMGLTYLFCRRHKTLRKRLLLNVFLCCKHLYGIYTYWSLLCLRFKDSNKLSNWVVHMVCISKWSSVERDTIQIYIRSVSLHCRQLHILYFNGEACDMIVYRNLRDRHSLVNVSCCNVSIVAETRRALCKVATFSLLLY